jgi:hypothetical protein
MKTVALCMLSMRYNNLFAEISGSATNTLFFHSAVIEYTNRVVFLEDEDVAAVCKDGCE